MCSFSDAYDIELHYLYLLSYKQSNYGELIAAEISKEFLTFRVGRSGTVFVTVHHRILS
jgi:hypothetical protein